MTRRRYRYPMGRVVGVGGLFGTAFGYVGTSIYVVLGGIALYALGTAPIVIALVGLVFLLTAWSYAEASAAMPDASGVTSFARRAFDPLTGLVAAWALLLDFVVFVAIACSFIPYYLGAVWPSLREAPYDTLIGVGVVAVLVALNVLGLQESVRLSSLMAVLGLATLVLLLVLGLATQFRPGAILGQIDLGVAPTWRHLLYAVPIAAAAFTGLDAISSRAESALRPGRDVPLAINVVLPVIVVVAVGLSVAALSALPVGYNVVPVDPGTGLTQPVTVIAGSDAGTYVLADDPGTEVLVPVVRRGAGHVIPAQEPTGEVFAAEGRPVTRLYGTALGSAYLEDPLVGLVAGLPDDMEGLKGVLTPWVALVAALALLLAAHAVMGGSARIVYSLARHHQVPAALGRLYAARMTPATGIVLFGLAAAAAVVLTDTRLLLGLFGFGAMVAFTLTHLSVIALRFRERGMPRPYVVPFGLRLRGAALPLPSVVGAVATALIWLLMVATHPWGRLVGFAWLAVGLAVYVVHRRRSGRPLLRQLDETTLPSAAVADVDYERILVPVVGTRLTDEMMVLGCQLAAEKGATIDVVHVVEVPMELSLDAPLVDQKRRGQRILDAAMAVAREFGVEAWPHLVTARQPGRAIVETAREWHADVIVLGAVKRRPLGDRLFGDTATFVMRNAPDEVLVNLVPADYPMDGSASELDARPDAGPAEPGPTGNRAPDKGAADGGPPGKRAPATGAPDDDARDPGTAGTPGRRDAGTAGSPPVGET